MAEEEKVKINAQEKLSYEQVLEVANGLQDQNQYLKNLRASCHLQKI